VLLDGGAALFGVGRPGNQLPGDGAEDSGGTGCSGNGTGGSGSGTGGSGSGTGESGGPAPGYGRPGWMVIAIGAIAAALAMGGVAYALSRHGGSAGQPAALPEAAAAASGPMRLESITPAAGARQIDGAAPITVSFSAQVAANSPDPTLQPAVAGTWSADGNMLVFTPATAFGPLSHVTVYVPAGPAGVRAADGALLTSPVSEHFTTGGYSQLRLAELLGQLGYLPMSWSPNGGWAAKDQSIAAYGASQTQVGEAYDPPAGTFHWQSGYPAELKSQWSPDQPNAIVRGAVMAFEAQHGMAIAGEATGQLWKELFRAASQGEQNPAGYSYAIASKSLPETLTIWHDGRVVMRSLTNTGIPVSPTVNGTFPVYERFRFQIMRGTNPDGSSYADPVTFVSYFNGGDAVHYFPRGSYGSQQSLGCVELPYTSAERAWPYLTYGSLVTVTG
jgi:Bacterial Ig-like domain/L,D-transpeptidase catalytic domain